MTIDVTDWRSLPAERWDQPDVPPHPLEGTRYTDPGFAAAEWDAIFTKTWQLLGREAEIPNPGDVQMEELGPESFLMVRQDDGTIKAFYNVCQHRGSRLVFAPNMAVRNIVCPYHSWTYGRDGTLVAVQDADDFPSNPCDDVRLVEVPCDSFAGWIFVNMDPGCMSLREYLGPIWDDWQTWAPNDWRRISAQTVNVPCNWKVFQDNFCESYHLLTVHPQLTANIEEGVLWTQFDMADEGHNRMIMRTGSPSRRQKNGPRLIEPLATQMRMWGLDPDEFVGREYDVRAALHKVMRVEGPARGYHHYDRLRDEQLTDAHHYNLFPNCSVTFGVDSVLLQRMRPHPTDPERCRFDHWIYASPASIAYGLFRSNGGIIDTGNKGDADIEYIEFGERSINPLADQDAGITTGQQLGLRSRGYRGARLAGQESRIARFHHVIDEYLAGKRR